MSQKIQYIGRRLISAFLTLLLLVTITFLLMHLLPGTPFSGNNHVRPEVEAALMSKYGLDKPLVQQYGIYLNRVFHGDLGNSLISGRPVTEVIAQAFPVSMELGIRALIFAVFMGIFLGIAAAMRHGSGWDTLIMMIALLGVSIPSFILGALLQYFFGLVLFQITGIRFFSLIGWNGEGSKILPAFALAFGSIAVISRLMRSSTLEVLGQDYIQTARAKGLNRMQIAVHHCLKNAVMPVITVLGPMTALLLTGTFVVEHVFVIPGLGKYFVDSIRSYDYPMIAGTTLFYGAFLIACNLVADLIQGAVDPRIHLEGE